MSGAVVISLSASSKTGRFFAYHVFRRDAEKKGPMGFLQVSQTPELLDFVPVKIGTHVPTEAVSYDQTYEAVRWISGLKPKKIVLVDFGARAGTLAQFIESIKGDPTLGEIGTTIVHVGSEQKVYSAGEIKESRESMQTMGKVQFNTSGVQDAVIAQSTAKAFYDDVQLAWHGWVGVSHEIMPDIQLLLGQGVSGDEGVEKGWSRLCQGSAITQEGLVYTM
ncbi:uncharacterized protein N7496_002065 [Penicillium cataractarum]|uniref:Uncharacterized protein n=1 Tax=Penicillium cataractarum TaxID=2100454 RepID=A0A9X0B7M6_9EURO|nr:uncharacterized protein N7496_002065 [Penicillium cataractarum]KAJ5390997.1 hypothetical protein N7496_002065 [Penicillium cataractarum]